MMNLLRILLVVVFTTGFTSCKSDDDANDIIISYEMLPQQSRDFLETYFTGIEVIRIEMKTVPDDDGTVYEILLANGAELDFDAQGLWTEIDCDGSPVPDDIIPEPILEYILNNYNASVFIESIEKKNYGYKVELSNGAELRFNAEGVLLGG